MLLKWLILFGFRIVGILEYSKELLFDIGRGVIFVWKIDIFKILINLWKVFVVVLCFRKLGY